jgi:ABC-type antimicrobial peptide transport system permease subunit
VGSVAAFAPRVRAGQPNVRTVFAERPAFGLSSRFRGPVAPSRRQGCRPSLSFGLALALGILFQYFAIAPMRGLGVKAGLTAAAKADFISLSCFEIGLFGWMALMAFVFFRAPHHLMPSSAGYWFLMQIGMIIGFFTSWPANVWLVNRGIKVPMRPSRSKQARAGTPPEM